jgi:hypothetical protein
VRVRRKQAPALPEQVLREVFALPDQWRAVGAVFEYITQADHILRKACERWPEHAQRLNASFKLLQPPTFMRGRVPEVYKAHVAELLERVVKGQDTRPGTDAEVLCAMLDNSLVAPPTDDMARLVEVLFQRVMPGKLEPGRVHEAWPGQHAEVLAGVRRVLAQADRR